MARSPLLAIAVAIARAVEAEKWGGVYMVFTLPFFYFRVTLVLAFPGEF